MMVQPFLIYILANEYKKKEKKKENNIYNIFIIAIVTFFKGRSLYFKLIFFQKAIQLSFISGRIEQKIKHSLFLNSVDEIKKKS